MTHKIKKCVSLLSGGLDSTVATAIAMRRYKIALALTFDYGQRAAKKEIAAARAFCRKFKIGHRVIKLPWLKKETHTALVDKKRRIPVVNLKNIKREAFAHAAAVWVPNRNGVFISIAAVIAESRGYGAIVAGFNAEEAGSFPDNSIEFIKAVNESLKFSTLNKLSLVCPVARMKKKEILQKLVLLGINPASLWYCYEGGPLPCGRCESCVRFGLTK